jgi:hypothetical protein
MARWISATSASSRVRIFLPTNCIWRRRPSWLVMVWHSRMASRTSSGIGTRLTRSRGASTSVFAQLSAGRRIWRLSSDLDGRSYSCSNSVELKPTAPRLGFTMILTSGSARGRTCKTVNDCYDTCFSGHPKKTAHERYRISPTPRTSCKQLARDVLGYAKAQGGTDCAVEISEGSGLSVSVRASKIETIEQNKDKGMGVTVFIGQRRGNASTSDFSPAALQRHGRGGLQHRPLHVRRRLRRPGRRRPCWNCRRAT